MPTPFTAAGDLDVDSIAGIVEQHVGLNVAGLLLGGSCGEGALMPDRQRWALVERVKHVAGNRLHITVQVSDASAARVIENMRHATAAGADSLTIAPPFAAIGFCNRDFVRRYFLESLDAAPLPVAIYIRPPAGPMELDNALWEEAIAHPRVSLVKNSSTCPVLRELVLGIKTRRPELCVLTGDEFNVTSIVAEGYDGGLLGSAILTAGMIERSLAALAAGDRKEADAWQAHSNQFLYDLFRPDISAWMSGLKYALSRLGLVSDTYSHLCFPLTQQDRERIDAALERERTWIMPAVKVDGG